MPAVNLEVLEERIVSMKTELHGIKELLSEVTEAIQTLTRVEERQKQYQERFDEMREESRKTGDAIWGSIRALECRAVILERGAPLQEEKTKRLDRWIERIIFGAIGFSATALYEAIRSRFFH